MFSLSQEIYENKSFYDGSEVYYLRSNKTKDFFSNECDLNSMDDKYLGTDERFEKNFLQNSTEATFSTPKIKMKRICIMMRIFLLKQVNL